MHKNGSTLHGLIILNNLKRLNLGMNRPLKTAVSPLKKHNIHLHFIGARTPLHVLHNTIQNKKISYDFVLFNSLASISQKTPFSYHLWKIMRHLNIPLFIYWHETSWVFKKHEQYARSAEQVRQMAYDDITHLVVSQAGADALSKQYPDIQSHLIYNTTTVPTTLPPLATPTDPPMVINVASIQERKGTDLFVETAIKVCQQHSSVEFMWVGKGQPYGDWQQKIKQAGLQDRILFSGQINNPHLLTRRAAIFFLSSRDDPFPLSVLEAMAMGRTVMTFDVGGAPEAVAEHGIQIPAFDTTVAADTMLDLLKRPLINLVKPTAHQAYLDNYTPDHFATRLNQVIRTQTDKY